MAFDKFITDWASDPFKQRINLPNVFDKDWLRERHMASEANKASFG